MNHDDPRHRTPPRAEPLQPDRPGRGTQKQDKPGNETPAGQQGGTAEGAENRKEQAETAAENVREGYGGG
jgi:hypothetical protein